MASGGAVVGLIFWRYLRSAHDEFWHHVMVDPEAIDANVTKDALARPQGLAALRGWPPEEVMVGNSLL